MLPNDNIRWTSRSRLDYLQLDGIRDLELPGPMAELVGSCIPMHAYHIFLIQSPSFIHLVYRCASLRTTFALSQSMIWFSSTAWSVMAYL